MGSIRYGKLVISATQQERFLHDLPHPQSRDCYFDHCDVVALLIKAGTCKICDHCGQTGPSAVTRRQARILAQRLLDNWRQHYLVTYSAVLDRYRRLP